MNLSVSSPHSWTEESRLEDLLVTDPNMLGRDRLIVGQQVRTASGKRLDPLGVDADGDLHIIKLEQDQTPKDVITQALDYGLISILHI